MKKNIYLGAPPVLTLASKAESASVPSQTQKPTLATAYSDQSQQLPIIVLKGKQVDARLSISRSARYEKLNPRSPRFDPTFPKPIKLGAASIGFIQSEINAWIASRITASRNDCKVGGQEK